MERKIPLSLVIYQGIIYLLFLTTDVSSDAVVQMEDTQIWGEQVMFEGTRIDRFLGIPYAEPPVGDGRFKKPEPLCSYPDTYQATNPPPACPQYTEEPFPWYFNDRDTNEDCLFLNVWRPADASPQNLRPVMVWVHSGQYKLGSASPEHYPGEPLSGLGDIVVVTFNYRLGILGFLSSDSDEAPGNAGLYDILEAMKWIQKNILYFGGDPSKVTLAGQSSSAVIVSYFTLHPESGSLFQSLIMQSGSSITMMNDYRERNKDLGRRVAIAVGCDEDDLAEFGPNTIRCLKRQPTDALVKAEFNMNPASPASFHPITGDGFLPANPRRDIMNGQFQGKTLMIGNNRDEGSMVASLIGTKHFGFYGTEAVTMTGDIAKELLGTMFKILPDLSPVLSAVSPDLPSAVVTPAVPDNPLMKNLPDVKSAVPVDKLPSGIPDVASLMTNSILGGGDSSSDPDCMRHRLHQTLGDLQLICPSVYFAEKCAEQGNDVYYYLFVHRPSNSPFAPWMGVTHYSEVPFVFGVPLIQQDSYTDEEIELSRRMIGYWTSFVKNGKPDISWPKYTKQKPIYKVLDVGNTTKPLGKGPHKQNCNLLRQTFLLL